MSGCEISQVYVGIAGGHIKGVNSTGTVAIKDKEVRPGDVAKVLELARAIALPVDRHIIHVLPQEYKIDGQDGVREPLGMCGVRLEARVHIVTAAAAAAQNIIKCCTRCDLEVLDIVLEPLASGEAVLEEDEKGLGVALVDIGGGTTDIAIFTDGAVAHTSVIPIGGHQVTSDIAFGLRTPPHEAEKIKIRSGCALSGMVGEAETLEVASVGGRAPRVLSRHTLCRDIIQPRIEEVFSFVKAEIIRLGCEDMLASGAVITGGTTQLAGMTELGEEILGIPVRRGAPKGVGGLAEVVRNATFSTAVASATGFRVNWAPMASASSSRSRLTARAMSRVTSGPRSQVRIQIGNRIISSARKAISSDFSSPSRRKPKPNTIWVTPSD